jgi:hypothetical protein
MGFSDALSAAADLATNQPAELPQFSLARRIVMQEVIGQADSTEWKTDRFPNVAFA